MQCWKLQYKFFLSGYSAVTDFLLGIILENDNMTSTNYSSWERIKEYPCINFVECVRLINNNVIFEFRLSTKASPEMNPFRIQNLSRFK